MKPADSFPSIKELGDLFFDLSNIYLRVMGRTGHPNKFIPPAYVKDIFGPVPSFQMHFRSGVIGSNEEAYRAGKVINELHKELRGSIRTLRTNPEHFPSKEIVAFLTRKDVKKAAETYSRNLHDRIKAGIPSDNSFDDNLREVRSLREELDAIFAKPSQIGLLLHKRNDRKAKPLPIVLDNEPVEIESPDLEEGRGTVPLAAVIWSLQQAPGHVLTSAFTAFTRRYIGAQRGVTDNIAMLRGRIENALPPSEKIEDYIDVDKNLILSTIKNEAQALRIGSLVTQTWLGAKNGLDPLLDLADVNATEMDWETPYAAKDIAALLFGLMMGIGNINPTLRDKIFERPEELGMLANQLFTLGSLIAPLQPGPEELTIDRVCDFVMSDSKQITMLHDALEKSRQLAALAEQPVDRLSQEESSAQRHLANTIHASMNALAKAIPAIDGKAYEMWVRSNHAKQTMGSPESYRG